MKLAIQIIFVELETGQNGTSLYLVKRPKKFGWNAMALSITTNQGILKASRGMGDDDGIGF